jgi:hypothetical protein
MSTGEGATYDVGERLGHTQHLHELDEVLGVVLLEVPERAPLVAVAPVHLHALDSLCTTENIHIFSYNST